MAGISKAERDRREAEAAAAARTSEGTGAEMEPAADGAAITGDGSGDPLPPVDGQDASNQGADEAAALQAKADAEAQAAAEAAAAAAAAANAGPALVHMTRDANAYPAPHTADVHPAEVDNYAAGGWRLASD